jgi:hypothetical protein
MCESGQDLNLSQSPLAVGLVLEWRDLFDGHFPVLGIDVGDCVVYRRTKAKQDYE